MPVALAQSPAFHEKCVFLGLFGQVYRFPLPRAKSGAVSLLGPLSFFTGKTLTLYLEGLSASFVFTNPPPSFPQKLFVTKTLDQIPMNSNDNEVSRPWSLWPHLIGLRMNIYSSGDNEPVYRNLGVFLCSSSFSGWNFECNVTNCKGSFSTMASEKLRKMEYGEKEGSRFYSGTDTEVTQHLIVPCLSVPGLCTSALLTINSSFRSASDSVFC